MGTFGPIRAIGVESTGSFGATLTRSLTAAGERVVEVNRPNRVARRMDGKSDRLDVRIINAATDELIRGPTIGPARDYQPCGRSKKKP